MSCSSPGDLLDPGIEPRSPVLQVDSSLSEPPGEPILVKDTKYIDTHTRMYACLLSRFSCVWLFTTLWTVAQQAPLSMGFSRQKYSSGLPCPPPVDLPDAGIEPVSLMSLALAGGFFTTSTTWEAHIYVYIYTQINCVFKVIKFRCVISPTLKIYLNNVLAESMNCFSILQAQCEDIHFKPNDSIYR